MKWKLALAQHPMYLLIREDTQCAERTPPWGAPDIESYIDRVRQNLGALERFPDLKLGYEWSGVELELLGQDAPEVLEQMRQYARQGRIQFYNGTYAQPHLQILSSESNLRQLEHGRRAYRELGLGQVLGYVHQEASVHEQLPQLLEAFGYRYAAVPGFLSTLVWLDGGEMVLHGVRGPRFVQGGELAAWQGLDGTQVPLLLHQPIPRELSLPETLARETVLGRLSAPHLMIDMPDMIDISPEWMAERQGMQLVLLDEAVGDLLGRAEKLPRARLYTQWSYLEGIRAEELGRANLQAERWALRAEALQALAFTLLGSTPASTDPIWKTILACQHHDVYCFSAPELRHKAIGWLGDCAAQAQSMAQASAQAIAGSIDTRQVDGECVVVFNSLPHTVSQVVDLTLQSPPGEVLDPHGASLPAEAVPLEDGAVRLSFPIHLPSLGYAAYTLRGRGEANTWIETSGPLEFKNSFYRAVVTSAGVFQSLAAGPDGFELLGSGGGNRLSATDSEGLHLQVESDAGRQQHLLSDPPERGPELHWETVSPALVLRSPLGVSLMASGKMGERIHAQLLIRFYHALPRIDLAWTFSFRQASVGAFFDDDSKLLLHWPLAVQGEIVHDIPFGAVQAPPERPFFPTRWVDICDGRRGVAFFHQGTAAFWVSGGTLTNLLAWGQDTDAIHNGLGRYRWLKRFDQRLDGVHTLSSAVYIHPGDWRAGAVAAAALAYSQPPLAVLTGAHPGPLPLEVDILHLGDQGAIATAVFTRGQQVVCRVYAGSERPAGGQAHLSGLRRAGFRSLAGAEIEALAPYQIGELAFERSDVG